VPNTFKVLFRGAASTVSTTLYTTPASTTTLINSILVTNTASANATYSLLLNGVSIGTSVSVPGNDTSLLEIKQVITASQVIAGFASASTVNFHISGLEIT
jgi:hypothetical protein